MCIRYILLCCCFSLAESALRWDQEPLNPTTASEGKNVSLKWDYNLDGGTLDLVTWIQAESKLTIGRITPPSSYTVKAKFRPRFTIDETEEATLIITNVSRSDAGEIACKVEDDVGEIVSTIRLIVLYPPENVSLHTSANVSATLRNSTVDFWCTADGNPAPHYKLSYNSTDLGENSSGTFQVRVTESGLYVCEANNSVGIGSASVHINVVDPATADVSSSPDHVVEGDNVTLHCKVTGSPPLSIKWTKVNESNVLSNSSNLTLHNVMRPNTSGEVLQYKCTAKNAYGDPASDMATIKVYYKPENVKCMTQRNSSKFVKGKDNVTFFFAAEALPQKCNVSLEQRGNGQETIVTKTRVCNGTFAELHTLSTVNMIGGNHDFSCLPKNIAGDGEMANVTIVILVPATIQDRPENTAVKENDDVTLNCSAQGFPTPDVVWFFPNGSVLQNSTTDTNLVLKTVSRDRGGSYRCYVSNEAGNDSVTVDVTVWYKPENVKCKTQRDSGKFVKGKDPSVTFFFAAEALPQKCNVSFTEHRGNGQSIIVTKSRVCNGTFAELHTLSTVNITGGIHDFSCSPKNIAGAGKRANVTIVILVPATIQDRPKNAAVKENEDVTLNCSAQGFPTPDVVWFSPNGSILQNSTTDTNLVLKTVSRDRNGTYRCYVSNEAGNDSVTVNVTVWYKPENVKCKTQRDSGKFVKGKDPSVTFSFAAEALPQKCNVSFTEHHENGQDFTVTKSRVCNGTFAELHTLSTVNMTGGIHDFSCSPKNIAGDGKMANVTIVILVPATILDRSENTPVTENDDITLNCSAQGFPTPDVVWFAPNGSVLQNSTTNTNLVLKTVSRDRGGSYRCYVSNEAGNDSVTVDVTVWYPPENTVMNVSVQEGNTSAALRDTFVTFNCTSQASPPPSVYLFYYNGTQFGNSSSGMLKKQVSESGHYFCAPKNKVGFGDNKSVSIAVVDSPTVNLSSNPNSVREGETVNLTCAVTGSKPISVEWKEDGDSDVLSSNRLLTLRNVTRPNTLNQTRHYRCTAKNGYGEPKSDVLTIRVFYPPENTAMNVRVPGGNTSAALRHTLVTFNCTSHASPPPSDYVVYHNGAPFGSSSSGMLQKQVSESGNYSCAPKNEVDLGDNASVSITVVVATKVAAPQSIQLLEGTSDTLFCNATGDPEPSVKWRKDDDPEVISTLPKYTVSADKAVTKYHCEAQNGYGHPLIQKVTFVVSVTKRKKEDSEFQVNLRIVSEKYVEEYSNPMSNETKALTSRLISENSLLFTKGNLKLLGIRIDRISKGSIVVEYTMFFRGFVETDAVADTIKKAIEDGRFGNFTVDKDSLKVTQTTATTTTTTTATTRTITTPTQKKQKVSLSIMIIIIIVSLVVVVILIIIVIWRCKKKRRCRKGSVDAEQDHDVVNGNGAVLAMQNMGYAKEGPSARDGSGYVQVENGPAPGAAEGNYAEVGKAGDAGGVPLVTYAAVDQSKKKKKKKGEKLEEDDMQGTATYAQVDKSKKKEGAAVPEENAYAAVDMSKKKKKRKDGELFYADLSEFSPQQGGLASVQISPPPTLGPVKVPPKYENTEYADISQFSSKKKEEPPAEGEKGQPQEQKPATHAAGPDGGILVNEQEASKDEQGQVEAKL